MCSKALTGTQWHCNDGCMQHQLLCMFTRSLGLTCQGQLIHRSVSTYFIHDSCISSHTGALPMSSRCRPYKNNKNERVAQLSLIEAIFHMHWPTGRPSSETSDPAKQACTGKGWSGAWLAVQHAKHSALMQAMTVILLCQRLSSKWWWHC